MHNKQYVAFRFGLGINQLLMMICSQDGIAGKPVRLSCQSCREDMAPV